MKKETFNAVSSLNLQTSYGIVRKEKDVQLEVTVGIKEDGSGWYEIYDVKTSGERWYASGELNFRGKKLVDYDGMFSLSHLVINKLEEWGYDTSEL
ncbi:MAG: hypothetical protein ACXABN_18805 [Candidatus Thorarchaeota archaeon]|jgi:hypothetical protein